MGDRSACWRHEIRDCMDRRSLLAGLALLPVLPRILFRQRQRPHSPGRFCPPGTTGPLGRRSSIS